MNEYALEIKNLTKKYKTFTLDNINFELPKGCIMGLVGENGAGKSTIINLIMDSIKRDSGTLKVLGCDCKDKEFTNVKNKIGFVMDEIFFPPMAKAKDINQILNNIYSEWQQDKFFEYIQKFNLDEKKKVKEYSKGMKMKLSFAAALSHNAELLILDEATSGLDPMFRDEILDELNEFTRDENHSVLMSSHIISDIEKICDYVTFIHKGKIMICEEKDALLDEYALLKISENEFADLPEQAVIGKKSTRFGIETLVRKNMISNAFQTEYTTLEDIILFMAKADK